MRSNIVDSREIIKLLTKTLEKTTNTSFNNFIQNSFLDLIQTSTNHKCKQVTIYYYDSEPNYGENDIIDYIILEDKIKEQEELTKEELKQFEELTYKFENKRKEYHKQKLLKNNWIDHYTRRSWKLSQKDLNHIAKTNIQKLKELNIDFENRIWSYAKNKNIVYYVFARDLVEYNILFEFK
jgi:hypothetical protein